MNSPVTSPETSHNGLTITIDKLSKRFNREWIFRDFSFQFIPGKTYAITGPNGSGKSTFLQVLWGQVPPSSGLIRFSSNSAEIPSEDCFRYLSIATPYMDLIEEFTLAEMMDFHFKLKKIRPGFKPDDVLEIMYLREAYEKPLMNFSSGMKQRVKLALAMYTDAEVFFLDEPGTNLDSRAFAWYQRELSLLPLKALVFIASNDAREYPPACTIVHLLDYKR